MCQRARGDSGHPCPQSTCNKLVKLTAARREKNQGSTQRKDTHQASELQGRAVVFLQEGEMDLSFDETGKEPRLYILWIHEWYFFRHSLLLRNSRDDRILTPASTMKLPSRGAFFTRTAEEREKVQYRSMPRLSATHQSQLTPSRLSLCASSYAISSALLCSHQLLDGVWCSELTPPRSLHITIDKR